MIPQVRMNHQEIQAWRGSFGKWDLNATELSHSLAAEYGPNLNGRNIPSIGTLLTCYQKHVVVDKGALLSR